MTRIEELIETIPLARGAKVAAWHESGLIAINKKAGIKTHPNSNSSADVAAVMARYNFNKEYFSWEDPANADKKYHLHLINRIDSPTSGLILASFKGDVARAARQAFKDKKGVSKLYKAVVFYRNMPESGVWRDYIGERREAGGVRAFISNMGHRAETKFSLDTYGDNNMNLALVNLEPMTGLTHQLRVQCQSRQIPILGDRTYGEFSVNKKIKRLTKQDRMFLHCAKTSISFEIAGERIDFEAEAPAPESFTEVINIHAEGSLI